MNSIEISDSERADARLSAETLHRAGAAQHERREFVVSFDYPPIPVRCFDWSAIDRNTYDGAPDSRQQVGRGPTAEAALLDLLDILEEDSCDCTVCDGRCGMEPPAMETVPAGL